MDRRAFLAAAGTVTAGLAGCSSPLGGDGDGDGQLLYSGAETPTILPGNFVPYRFSIDDVATLSYSLSVVEGPNVDLIATTEQHAEAFANGERWQFFDPASVGDTAEASVEAVLETGNWVLILDNSREGRAHPWRSTETATPADWRSGDATPTPTPAGRPATVQFEYAVTAGEQPTGGSPTGTPTGTG